MTTKAQVLIIIILAIGLYGIIHMVKKRELDLKYVIASMACDVALIILTLFPNLMNGLAALFGIVSPVNMLFFFGFVFSLVLIFSLTSAVSKATAKVRNMAQEMALMEDRLTKLINEKK